MTAPRRTAGPGMPLGSPRSGFRAVQPLDRPVGAQTLVLEDFPAPALARALSPNGRVHWAKRSKAKGVVAERVAAEARVAGLRPAAGPVRLTFRWVFPTRARRDIDNLSTGVTKSAIDSLVRGGWLADDDSDHVVAVTALAVYERGRRALEIVMEEAA